MTDDAAAERLAWAGLVHMLASADAGLGDPARSTGDPVDRAEGYKALTELLVTALEIYVNLDPHRPAWWRMVTPTRKFLGDNTDSRYDLIQIDPVHTYRITGVRGDDCYLAFCVYGGPDDGHWSTRVVANVHHGDLGVEAGEPFEIVLSPDDAPRHWEPTAGRVWIRLTPDATTVICRQYFWDPATAAGAALAVTVDPPVEGPPPPIDGPTVAARLVAATNFMADSLNILPFGHPPANTMMAPFAFLEGAPGWGTPDNIYAIGSFALADDEGLVIRGRSPASAYWGLQLWNSMMQSLDWQHHRVSRNARQIALEPDGSWRVVVAGRDPGPDHPNWIATAGHPVGIVFCRWLLAESMPDAPTTEVITLPD